LLEKKKISTERRLISAEKAISSLEKSIAANEANFVDLLERLLVRDGDIDETGMEIEGYE
jgi:hypothetical protein